MDWGPDMSRSGPPTGVSVSFGLAREAALIRLAYAYEQSTHRPQAAAFQPATTRHPSKDVP